MNVSQYYLTFKKKLCYILKYSISTSYLILGVVKRNPLFLHEIEWKNNGFLFTTPNINFFIRTFYYLIICDGNKSLDDRVKVLKISSYVLES